MSKSKANKINVLFVTRRFPPSVGGMQRYAYDLQYALREKTNVSLVSWGGKNKYMSVLALPAIVVKSVWILMTQNIDVLHMQDGVLSTVGLLLRFFFRKPVFVVIHGLDVTHPNRLYQAVIPWCLRRVDHVFCISSAAQQEVLNRGISRSKTSINPLGAVDDIFTGNREEARSYLEQKGIISKSSQVLLSVGRLVKRKGVTWFIENVMPSVVRVNKDAIFVICGDGEEVDNIKEAIKKKDLQDHVALLGLVDEETKHALYNGSDIFVMPNITVAGDIEGFGRVLHEAALCELPIVATGIEGIKDAVTNAKNGVLVPEKDSKAYITSILSFLGDKKTARRFGKKARQFTLAEFSWSRIAEGHKEIYEKILNGRGV